MQFEVGSILEGRVTGITKFGAFVEIAPGKSGMVHISEISTSYVNEISDHIKEGQNVRVKVLSVSDDGKISLSIKKVDSGEDKPKFQRRNSPDSFEWSSRSRNEGMSFEDMMQKFKQTSDDKMSDLKKYIDVKRSSARRSK